MLAIIFQPSRLGYSRTQVLRWGCLIFGGSSIWWLGSLLIFKIQGSNLNAVVSVIVWMMVTVIPAIFWFHKNNILPIENDEQQTFAMFWFFVALILTMQIFKFLIGGN